MQLAAARRLASRLLLPTLVLARLRSEPQAAGAATLDELFHETEVAAGHGVFVLWHSIAITPCTSTDRSC